MSWLLTFGLLSALAVTLMAWVVAKLPAFPGSRAQERQRVASVLAIPGVGQSLLALLLYVVAHPCC
ncbi:hypothetical protein [Pseudoduganella lurida]|uniref:hypothetical protein n=1 Tax=Pseudoduganella lurida TaxID=1036180 RepID=UPI0011A95B5D|nr:hypothetical protein [Pseudoduganella lurida]